MAQARAVSPAAPRMYAAALVESASHARTPAASIVVRLSAECPLGRQEQFIEVVAAAIRLETLIVHRETLHDGLTQPLRGPHTGPA